MTVNKKGRVRVLPQPGDGGASVQGEGVMHGRIMGRKRVSEGNTLMRARVRETETCRNTLPSKLCHETQEGAGEL